MPEEKTIDEMIEDEQARRNRVRQKVRPFTNRQPVEHTDDIPEKEPEKEIETPLSDFIDNWKVGAKRIFRR